MNGKLMVIVMPMLEGCEITLQIFSLTLIMALPLGLLAAMAKLSKFRLVRFLTDVYISG